jgi:hypothetical protein
LKIKEYETNKTFKNIWTTKLPCAKFVVSSNGMISQIKCMCSQIKRREKLLVPKLDGLYKHCDRKKTQVDTLGQPKNMIYFESNNLHQKNERQPPSQSHAINVF